MMRLMPGHRMPGSSPGPDPVLVLPDAAALADLAAYIGRAKRVDPDGAARLVGHGDVLAAYVSPVHGGGGPTVLGLRTMALARPSAVDVTVSLASLNDRLARLGVLPAASERSSRPDGVPPAGADPVRLPIPPTPAGDASWAGVAPPRSGWEALAQVQVDVARAAVRAGMAEVAAGSPPGAGAPAVARLRALVWGRPLAEAAGVPAGVAYAAEALGFLCEDEPAALYRCGPWTRLTTSAGHVLARRPALLQSG